MRQKEEFQKGTNKNLHHSQKKIQKERMKNIFAKRGNLFFTKQFNQVERVRNISGVNFQKVVSKKEIFVQFFVLGVRKTFEKENTVMKEGEMND